MHPLFRNHGIRPAQIYLARSISALLSAQRAIHHDQIYGELLTPGKDVPFASLAGDHAQLSRLVVGESQGPSPEAGPSGC
jgi:hypothetical protein